MRNECIPLHDRVLVQRIEETSKIHLTDAPKSIKGIVLAVGPGKYDDDGDLVPLTLKPGDKVLFNSKWNDFSAGENKGTGADGSGPLERPLPLKQDPLIHLIQEADVLAIVPHFDFRCSLKEERPAFMQNIEIKGPWNS